MNFIMWNYPYTFTQLSKLSFLCIVQRSLNLILLLLAIPLAMQAQSVRTMVQTGHTQPIKSFDISPNGRLLVSLDKGLKCCVWDLHTGRQLIETYDFFSGKSIREVSFHKRRSDWVVLTDEENSHILDLRSQRRIGLIKKEENKVKVHSNQEVTVKAEGNDLLVYSKATGRQLSQLTSLASPVRDVKSIARGRRLLAMGLDEVVCWNLELGSVEYAHPLEHRQYTLAVDREEKHFITAEGDRIAFRHVQTGETDFTVNCPDSIGKLWAAAFDESDHLLLATTQGLFGVEVAQRKMFRIATDVEGKKNGTFLSACYDPVNRHFIVSSAQSTRLYTLTWGRKATLNRGFFADAHCYDIKATSEGIFCCGDFRVCHFYKRSEAAQRHTPYHNANVRGQFYNYACCPVGKERIAVGNSFGGLQIFNLRTRELEKNLTDHHNTICGMDASADGRHFFTASEDGSVGVWDAATCRLVAKLVYFRRGNNYAIITGEGYYTASKGAFTGLHFIKGLEVYGFDQFDLQYNRPDLVLARLGYASDRRIEMLHKVYRLRLKRMGYTEEQTAADGSFHLPVTKVDNLAQIAYEQPDGHVRLQLTLSDSRYPLDRLMVRINGVPLGGVKGMDLRKEQSQSVSRSVDVELLQGENLIEVSCLNRAGAESYKRTLQVRNGAKPTRPNLYIVAVGTSQHAQSQFDLHYAAKDAEDLSRLFEQRNRGHYGRIETRLLTNRQVTRESLRELIPWLSQARIHDTVLLFYAGHGLLTDDYEQYLAAWDIDFAQPKKRGIPYELLEDLLGQAPAANKLMMVDACHSGYIDKEWIDCLSASQTTRQEAIRFRSSSSSVAVAKVEYKDITRMYDELFSDTQQESGATILASAGGIEVAMEGDEWQNGLFTSAVIEAIARMKADDDADGCIRVQEMQRYVTHRVKQCSQGIQEPNARTENPRQNFIVAHGSN